ncbi:hypothetical protein [Catenovulum adriaticum]|uniref:Uncharacterized protein n=1 Tax=Catenovulum adriaticum TaxID=2984846 RepID=A0ABY7AQ12_9ALTE|nr:hypothetical protein [Catenovulum sp. TS8]WAJ70399.1 hypothetical protein OLW01_00865 [Catenovulum sp. TS8]
MISNIQLTQQSVNLLQKRDLSQSEINQFSGLLSKTNSAEQSAHEKLQSLTPEELKLVQKANSLAQKINISQLSEEGASNLLKQPDNSNKVDLNNDGIVEVGTARNIVFPPVNAPESVKRAWEESTEGMPEMEKMTLQLTMHTAIYGFNINGAEPKPALPPKEQWNAQNIDKLFEYLQGTLDFRVNQEGWTEHNLMLKDFYACFESNINKQTQQANEQANNAAVYLADQDDENNHNHYLENTQDNASKQSATQTNEESTQTIIQLLLDAQMGIDREKIDKIDEKIKAVNNNTSLSAEQKQGQLKSLEEQKQALIEDAQKQRVEAEKRKALLGKNDLMLENFQESSIKNKFVAAS